MSKPGFTLNRFKLFYDNLDDETKKIIIVIYNEIRNKNLRKYCFCTKAIICHCKDDMTLETFTSLLNMNNILEDELYEILLYYTHYDIKNAFIDEKFINNVCLSYRHDFGLLSPQKQKKIKYECSEWMRAISNNWLYRKNI